jgi:tetratricopeptide (TPR) repeat protein
MCGGKEQRETLSSLFALLSREYGQEEQFALVREIANVYMRQKEYGKLVNFLNQRIRQNPEDPYHSYYLFMTAYVYVQQEAWPVAALYYDIIIKNYPDLMVRGESIHLACLNQLITLIENPERRVRYYEELISRFPGKIDQGASYFMLAQAYEQIGDWTGAIHAYTQFLPYMGTVIPGFPNADIYAKRLVDFNNSSKNWTFENINTLIAAIKSALNSGSSSRLRQYQAKVNFFARSWEQEDTSDSGMAEFSLTDLMRGRQIHFAENLETGSHANEVYLKTWGWSQYIPTWYLYFRKIYFPLDPEIHGRWEWAGVYYGEKF